MSIPTFKTLAAHKLLLASKSPRRAQLLEQMGLKFSLVSIDCDESYPDDLAGAQVAEYIAHSKSKAYKLELNPSEILITADCIVLHEETILPKPKDEQEALNFLLSMRGKTHQVLSGVCLRSVDKIRSFTDISSVQVADFSEEEVNYYVSNYQPFDKAGAYGIQEWFGHCLIQGIEGSYTNIMGLPTEKLYRALKEF